MKHRTCSRIVLWTGTAGWLVTGTILVVARPWGLRVGALLWVLALALLPYVVLALFSSWTPFPLIGRWLVCATTTLVAVGGIYIYVMMIGNSCMGGLAIVVVPAFQWLAVVVGLALAFMSRLVVYLSLRWRTAF